MDNLKELLFKTILFYDLQHKKACRQLGDDFYTTLIYEHRLHGFLEFLENAGLEEEYQEWKQQQERGDRN